MLLTPQSAELELRWQRIAAWLSDDSALSTTFRRQLAEANGWSAVECLTAIEEYRRFCFIAAISSGEVSPSPAVDQVWHLHLTYSRDYWHDFCPLRLGFDLHHQPGMGQPGEAAQLRNLYALTLERYQSLFGTPPRRWWPPHPLLRHSATGLRGRLHRFGWRLAAGLAGLLGLSSLAQGEPGNPLNWQGPEFLVLFFLLMVAAVFATALLRFWMSRVDDGRRGLSLSEPDVWSIAYLSGGPQRVLDAAVAQLHEQGHIRWDESGKHTEPTDRGEPDDPLLRTVLAACRQRNMSRLLQVVKSAHLDAILRQLQQRGWWFSAEQALRVAQISALPFALLAGFGLLKIGIGLSRDKPVLFLVLLTLLCLVIAAVMYFKRPGVTPAGRKAFAELKRKHELLGRSYRDEQVAMAVALAGTSVLAGTALAGYHDVRRPQTSSDSGGGAGCSSSGGGDGGSSGCGGCGGGD